MDTNLTMGYQVFTILVSVFSLGALSTISNAIRNRSKLRISAERILPRFGTVGQRIQYQVKIRNHSKSQLQSIGYIEGMPDPRPDKDVFLNSPVPGESHQPFIDRKFGIYRWGKLIERNMTALTTEHHVPPISPKSEIVLDMDVMPLRRGHIHFSGMIFAQPEPFGLIRNLTKIPSSQSLVILPKRYHLPDFIIPGRQRYQQGGLALASSVGESEEFVSLREYRPGDPIRRIHWRSWARTGTPVVKEYQDEFFVRHALILDTYTSNDHEDVFEEAVSVAASFACTLQKQDSILDLMFVGSKAFHMTSGRGIANTERVLEVLASVTPSPSENFETLKNLALRHVVNFSGCVCVLTRWDEERCNLVQQLESSGVPTQVLLICQKDKEVTIKPAPPSIERFHVLKTGQIQEDLQRK